VVLGVVIVLVGWQSLSAAETAAVGPLVHNQGGQQACRYARHVPAIAEQRVYMKCMTQRKEVNAYKPKDLACASIACSQPSVRLATMRTPIPQGE
jgi:hypothetical protein